MIQSKTLLQHSKLTASQALRFDCSKPGAEVVVQQTECVLCTAQSPSTAQSNPGGTPGCGTKTKINKMEFLKTIWSIVSLITQKCPIYLSEQEKYQHPLPRPMGSTAAQFEEHWSKTFIITERMFPSFLTLILLIPSLPCIQFLFISSKFLFCFVWGYTWQYLDHMGCQRRNLGQQHARQIPYTLYYCSDLLISSKF